jgi:hypothetical protein
MQGPSVADVSLNQIQNHQQKKKDDFEKKDIYMNINTSILLLIIFLGNVFLSKSSFGSGNSMDVYKSAYIGPDKIMIDTEDTIETLKDQIIHESGAPDEFVGTTPTLWFVDKETCEEKKFTETHLNDLKSGKLSMEKYSLHLSYDNEGRHMKIPCYGNKREGEINKSEGETRRNPKSSS